MRSTANVDNDLAQVLTKWEAQNKRMFEKYPVDKQMKEGEDLSVLDLAREEVHRPKPESVKLPPVQKKNKTPSPDREVKQLKALMEKQFINKYLRKIKEREGQGSSGADQEGGS